MVQTLWKTALAVSDKVKNIFLTLSPRGSLDASVVEHLTLGFTSGHDLKVCEIKPDIGLYAHSAQSAWDSLSPSSSAPPLLACCLSLSK